MANSFAKLATVGNWLSPVSYTHLDVYERQAQHDHRQQDAELPCKQLAQRRPDAGIGKGQRDGSLQHLSLIHIWQVKRCGRCCAGFGLPLAAFAGQELDGFGKGLSVKLHGFGSEGGGR